MIGYVYRMGELDHRILRQVVAVADAGTVRAAAQALHISQPPLTAAIRGLEKRLGVTLFNRSVRGMQLTPAGAVLVAEARIILARLDRAERRVREVAGHDQPLRIGFVSAALNGTLARLLQGLLAEGRPPPLLAEMTTPEQFAALADARLDLGLLHPPVETLPEGCEIVSLGRDPFMAALPAGHALADAESVSFADLAGEAFVLFPEAQGPKLLGAIRNAVAEAGGTLHVAATARRIHTQLAIVAGGVGVGLITEGTAKTLAFEGVVFRPIEDGTGLFMELAMVGEPRTLQVSMYCT